MKIIIGWDAKIDVLMRDGDRLANKKKHMKIKSKIRIRYSYRYRL